MIKTYDNFKIITMAGEEYDMATDFNVLVRSFVIGTPRPEITTEKLENYHGQVRLGKTWGARQLTAQCSFFAADAQDTVLLRNELFRTLMNLDEFYIVVDAEQGKRWRTEVAGEFTPSKTGAYGEFTIDFVCHSVYAESIGTTLDPKTFDAELWQIGEGLTLDETAYTHSTTTFQIYAAENGMTIDPRNIPLTITYKGASTNLEIKNTTTGDTWQYIGTTVAADTLKIDGVRSLKNNVSVFGDTNRQLITLAPGWNSFELTGTSGSFNITFDFRFYYL
jgi:hypothetical protein